MSKIIDVFLAQALRIWLLDRDGDGFTDPRGILDGAVAKAVRALNSSPSEPWSLDRLARHVGLSRTALATKFRDGVGEPPMRYLAEVRLRRAARELADGQLTLHEVARRAALPASRRRSRSARSADVEAARSSPLGFRREGRLIKYSAERGRRKEC